MNSRGLGLPVAPLAAGALALLTALIFALMPASFLEGLALDSGIAAVFPAAEPPLGFTARAVLILIGGGGTGLIAWFGFFLLLGGRTVAVSRAAATADPATEQDVPVLRRADAHPDAPPRRPLFANRDLGTPFLDVHAVRRERAAGAPAVQPLPTNLDLPLAAFDPAAIPDDPADWFPAPAILARTPRRQLFDAGERFETFELPQAEHTAPSPPPVRAPLPPVLPHAADHDSSASIHALLDRLERGVGRRETVVPPIMPPEPKIARGESLEEALVSLRRLATRG